MVVGITTRDHSTICRKASASKAESITSAAAFLML